MIECNEVIAVDELCLLSVRLKQLNRLNGFLVLHQTSVGVVVRINQSIHNECAIMDFLAKVTGLLRAFRDHKVKDHEKYNYLYSSLCDFKMACDESFNDTPEPYASQVEIDAWTNVNFFFSRVTAEGLLDLSMYAIWTMRQALEEEQQDDVEGTAAQKYNVYVPAAAAWVLGFGRTLYRKEEDLTPTDRKYGNPAKGGALWKGKPEFSKERWALWKERFAVVSKMDEVSDKTRNISKDALQAMERAETYNESSHSVGSAS